MLRLLAAASSLALAAGAQAQSAAPAQNAHQGHSMHATATTTATSAAHSYPVTRRGDVVDSSFGEKVPDPYRWLENDVRQDKEVAAWVEAQNKVTQQVLTALPGRAWFKERIGTLMNYERYGIPIKAGNHYFYGYNPGLLNQPQLFVREGLNGTPRLLIDPNTWAQDGATALSGYRPSNSGKLMTYEIQDGGTDWRIIRVKDVTTGKDLGDELRWAKYGGGVAWLGDEGFFYSRFPATGEKPDFQSLAFNQAVYYHKLGTPQSADVLVFSTPANKEYGHFISVSSDERWATITSSVGTDSRYEVHTIDLKAGSPAKGWKAKKLISGFENAWGLIDTVGNTAFFQTNKDAPKHRVVKMDMSAAKPTFTTVVAETDQPIDGASIVGDRLVLTYLKDATTRAAVYSLDGKPLKDIALGELGTAGGFSGKPGDPETFYSFTSFTRPATIYRFDIASGKTEVFAEPKMAFDPNAFEAKQVFYPSKDGTKIPMFIVRKKGQTGPAPTLLYGYGGFDVSLTPGFSAGRMAWLEAGGTYALANLRGGGEYGKAWHDAGRLANKQNVFDDFAWAGKYLKANGYTTPKGLSIQGGSNGGLLVGAVVNQHPDLIDAASPAVGVMDMLRFDQWTAGRYWVDDYGYPSKEEDWRRLRAYSPYHNIRADVDYPPVLVTTADTDDRVVPGHSFKYAAALQAADPGGAPHLIRIETRAGHGSGKPTDKIIEEGADVMAFLAHFTGLEVPPKP
ncbi:prolyl oligopeptidase family serine peptidase [Qipengyuania sediminis]|uniref:prolyl oligopeptidase family serine peptidase n=1 Tax=Qipengyuania sediminis TaxID=1532023 RepID=UPI00197F2014|nr:prolyl oligopeptidase family serine peptidase [Qipengyuania sediminis]